jgi:hypothetical protein
MTVPRGAVILATATIGVLAAVNLPGAGPTARHTFGSPRPPAVQTRPAPIADQGPVRLRDVDGGTDYFSRWPASLPASPSFFPVGVWFESVTSKADVDQDRAAGLNTYVALTANSDLRLIASGGMKALVQWDEWIGRSRADGSDALAGWLLADEIDMVQGPSRGPRILRDTLRRLPDSDGRLRYNNYGKGVLFWETDEEAARFVNDFQDVVSADAYWFTDKNICGAGEGGALLGGGRALSPAECHRAANYGATVARVRSLVDPPGSRPVWNFVEVGHPAQQASWPTIRPPQVAAAVWSSIIHGARGIVYFNHSFGGPAPTQHALRESQYAPVRAVVTETNRRIAKLAPVLNAPFAEGLVTASGEVDVMAKFHDDRFYVFAGSASAAAQAAEFHLACDVTGVQVLFEDRILTPSGRSFTDHFADANAVHIYSLDVGGCG